MNQFFNHVRSNAVAYTALFFAVGGGGGSMAIAAAKKPAAPTTVTHACVYKKTGALLLKSRCNKVERPVVWTQAPNIAHGVVLDGVAAPGSSGFTAQAVNANDTKVTLTGCPPNDVAATLVVTPAGGPSSESANVNGAEGHFDVFNTSNNRFQVLGEC